jgi:hypothetical protein
MTGERGASLVLQHEDCGGVPRRDASVKVFSTQRARALSGATSQAERQLLAASLHARVTAQCTSFGEPQHAQRGANRDRDASHDQV